MNLTKKLTTLLLLLFSMFNFAQTVNNYELVLLPVRFDFQSKENQYRVSTILKIGLSEVGFKVMYSNEYAKIAEYQPCQILIVKLKEVPTFLKTKFTMQLVDCEGNILYETPVAQSKEKAFEAAHRECMEQIVGFLKEMNYKFEGEKVLTNEEESTLIPTSTLDDKTADFKVNLQKTLYAQPTENGFQLVDTTPQVVIKLFKTSQPDFYSAQFLNLTGMVFKKDNQWFFEYSDNGDLKTVTLDVKF